MGSGVIASCKCGFSKEIKEKVEELENFYNLAVNREVKMTKLKKEIEKLKSELSKYKK